jgi:hypothetical protein
VTIGQQFDIHGTLIPSSIIDPASLAGMVSPVRCTRCSQVYDMAVVTVTARYSDCSVWTSPCCQRSVDDRGPGLKSVPDIERLDATRRSAAGGNR